MTNTIEVNEAVMHIPEGVCKVTGIIERDLSSLGTRQYYILVPVYNTGTKIYIPTDNGPAKMRELLTRDEVLELIDSIPECESVWVENDKERMAAFSSIVSRCDHHEMLCAPARNFTVLMNGYLKKPREFSSVSSAMSSISSLLKSGLLSQKESRTAIPNYR